VAGRHVNAAGAVAAVEAGAGRQDVAALGLQAVNLEAALAVGERVERGTRAVAAVGERVLDAHALGRLAVGVLDDPAERGAPLLDRVEVRVAALRLAARRLRLGDRGRAVEPVARRLRGGATPRDGPARQVTRRLAPGQQQSGQRDGRREAVESSRHPVGPPRVATVAGRKIVMK